MKAEIAFIGGGNMADSLIGGMIAGGREAGSILVCEPDPARRAQITAAHGIQAAEGNAHALEADVIVLAVKPQVLQAACRELAGSDTAGSPLYISIAAGIRTTDIARWLAGPSALPIALVRAMPNTPALLQCGATALFANPQVGESQKHQAQAILEAAGMTCWVEDEAQLDAVTALSGSGPAYFFLMMETMQAAGEKLGLPAPVAKQLVIQTALGAARMAGESGQPPAELRARVTSKGGTTAAAIASFEAADFAAVVEQALGAAFERSRQIAAELGKDEL
jgi:pyrroline-5-carboxylate reductase